MSSTPSKTHGTHLLDLGRRPGAAGGARHENLGTALQLRFKRGGFTDEQALAVANAIDAAARVVEQN